MNPARDDEERANQGHETDVIGAFTQDWFGLPNREKIVGSGGGREKERDEMVMAFPMMF